LNSQAALYHVQMEGVTGWILAGGKSSRMGCDKALLDFAGRPLLRHALELASSVIVDVRILGDPAKYAAFGAVIADVYSERGPLAGIHAALANSGTDLNLILATDLPFLEPRFLRYLIAAAQATDALVTVPRIGSYFEPLCAVYRKRFGELVEAALSKDQNKVDALFADVSTRIITEEEIIKTGFDSAMFRNLNSPDDLRQAQQQLP
jgi:molybdopterin-guanine dinucleotide biosynthesis protein A